MKLGEVMIRKGPVYVDGKLVFTATRDLRVGDAPSTKDIILPDGTHPKEGDMMTDIERRVLEGTAEITQ